MRARSVDNGRDNAENARRTADNSGREKCARQTLRYGCRMETWESVLADIESDMEARARSDMLAQAEELRRAEDTTVALAQRLQGMRGREIAIQARNGVAFRLVVRDCAEQWLLGRSTRGTAGEMLVPLDGIVAVFGMRAVKAGEFRGIVARRLSLGAALRAIADRHAAVAIHAAQSCFTGRIVRVGKDYVDVAGATGPVAVRLAEISRIEARGVGG